MKAIGVALLAGLVLAAAGCEDDDVPAGDHAWAVSGDTLPTDVVTWSDGSTVHVGDTVVETGERLESYVVAGDAVWFVPTGGDTLWRADADGAAATDARPEPGDLLASADGRYLAFLDLTTGDPDRFDTPVAQAVVVDLAEGEVITRTSDGMGDPGSDDLADLYEDADLGVLGVSADAAWFVTPGGVLEVDLPGGEVTLDPADEVYDPAQPWFAARGADGGPVDPSGTWAVQDTPTQDLVVPVDGGEPVTPDTGTPTWSLLRWLADDTVVGFAFDGPAVKGAIDPDAPRTLVTCTVPGGDCTPVPGTTGVERVILPTPALIPPEGAA